MDASNGPTNELLKRHPFVLAMLADLQNSYSTTISLNYSFPDINITCSPREKENKEELSNHLSQNFLRQAFYFIQNAFHDSEGDENNNLEITNMVVSNYSFTCFPERSIGVVFPNLVNLSIFSNASFHSDGLKSILTQLPLLQFLRIDNCPNMCSLSPLVEWLDDTTSVLPNLNIKVLSFRYCGITDPDPTEWDQIMSCLAQSFGPIESLELTGTKISFLPSSIHYLKNSLNELIVSDNPNFKKIPDEIALLYPNMGHERQTIPYLCFSNNTLLEYLPTTIGRLDDSVQIMVSQCPNLKQPSKCYRGSVCAMRVYFMLHRCRILRGIVRLIILLKKARMRANERLFQPGARGYQLCEARFKELQSR